MFKNKISICIPTYECSGRGVEFLTKLIQSIEIQTYKNFNIIISDHSLNDDIKNFCNDLKDIFEILYIKNEHSIGNSPSNTNNSIKNADGDIIKIMFQDDFFYNEKALELIVKEFENDNCHWLVTSCNHTNDDGKTFNNFMTPYWNENIIMGINTISSPSVLSFRNNNSCEFDENLVMLMDCEMYYQLYLKYGLPIIINEVLVTNRLHSKQISSMYSTDINIEINYIINKHNILYEQK
jgi:glycosyltransferase involved in cell wall biosynthesis